MTYGLYIGDRSFSSWSMRGWLMFKAFDIPFTPKLIGLYSGTMAADMAEIAPARLVPAMRTPEGHVTQETMAMAETLAENHPDAGLWPRDKGHRILARWAVSEMHAGFGDLRGDCGMNLRQCWADFEPSVGVKADVARIETLWDMCFEASGSTGWLFGDYSLADVFYAPIAARLAGYGLKISPRAQAYVDHHLAHDLFRQWRAMGQTVDYDPNPYQMPLTKTPWPGPAILPAKAVEASTSENSPCPYSGKAVTHFLEIDGRTFGFCNAFCRDKTVADPGAWPEFMEIYQS